MYEYGKHLARVFHANLVTLVWWLAYERDPEDITGKFLARQIHRLSIGDPAIGLGIIAYFTQGIAAIQLILVYLKRRELSLALCNQAQQKKSHQNH